MNKSGLLGGFVCGFFAVAFLALSVFLYLGRPDPPAPPRTVKKVIIIRRTPEPPLVPTPCPPARP